MLSNPNLYTIIEVVIYHPKSWLVPNFNKPFQGFGTCPDSTCPNYIGGDEETIDVGNTTVIGGNIPGSGGYYPYGQQAGSFLVEDVLPEIMN